MRDSTSVALTELHKNIGLKDTIELLEFALPRIARRGDELQRHLLTADWDAASRIAHQTLSSVHLYSSSQFEQQLQQIHQQNIVVIDTPSFQQELREELDSITHAIRVWLDAHLAT